MTFSKKLKQALNSEQDAEFLIDTEAKQTTIIDVVAESVHTNKERRITEQNALVPKQQDVKIQQNLPSYSDGVLLRPDSFWPIENETRNLNVFNNNHEAHKKYRKMQEEKYIESQVCQAQAYLAGQSMLTLYHGSQGQPNINWNLLPKDMYQIVEAVAGETGWNPFEVLMVCLASITMAMRGRYVIKLDDLWDEPIILYQAIIAPSGKKKSLLAKIFKSIFLKFIEDLQQEYSKSKTLIEDKKVAVQSTKEKLKRNIISSAISDGYDEHYGYDFDAIFSFLQNPIEKLERSASKFEVHAGKAPHFFAEHATFRGLLDLQHAQGSCIALFGEEGNGFLEMLNTPGANLDLFLKGYTMENFTNDNARSGNTHIKKPVLNMLFIVQDYILRQIYKSERLATVGVTPRFLPFFCSDGNWQNSNGAASKEAISLYEDKIQKMLQRNYTQDSEREIFICTVDKDAYREAKQYQAHIANLVAGGKHKHMESFLDKLHGTASRIAGVIHAWTHDQPEQYPITNQEMLLGIQIADAHREHASFAFDPSGIGAFHDAQKILAWVKRHGHSMFKARDIAQGISNMTNVNIYPALDLLQQHYILAQIIIPGRSRLCVMHPQFFDNNYN